MCSLHYTIIDSENNVVEAEFDDEYKVLFKKETYDSNDPNKQKIWKTLKEDTSEFMFEPPGIYFALRYLYSDKEPNYVLCGYFASLIKTLLKTKPTLIINYFYKENKDFIPKLIKYSYRESISEILNLFLVSL